VTPPSQILAVVFDLDDTLYAERTFAFSGYAAVAAAYANILGDPAAAAAEMRDLYGTGSRGRVFNVLCERRGLTVDEDLVARMVTTFRTHRPSIQLHADGERALTRLRGRYRLGLISDGPLAMQQAKVDALQLADRLDAIVLTDQWGREFWKPHPRAYEAIARQFGVLHAACVYIADNPSKDFVAPRALGWRCVRVIREDGVYADHPIAPGGEPHATITSLDELDPLLV
jgi:putative hydrolase of the HAD superfamily